MLLQAIKPSRNRLLVPLFKPVLSTFATLQSTHHLSLPGGLESESLFVLLLNSAYLRNRCVREYNLRGYGYFERLWNDCKEIQTESGGGSIYFKALAKLSTLLKSDETRKVTVDATKATTSATTSLPASASPFGSTSKDQKSTKQPEPPKGKRSAKIEPSNNVKKPPKTRLPPEPVPTILVTPPTTSSISTYITPSNRSKTHLLPWPHIPPLKLSPDSPFELRHLSYLESSYLKDLWSKHLRSLDPLQVNFDRAVRKFFRNVLIRSGMSPSVFWELEKSVREECVWPVLIGDLDERGQELMGDYRKLAAEKEAGI